MSGWVVLIQSGWLLKNLCQEDEVEGEEEGEGEGDEESGGSMGRV